MAKHVRFILPLFLWTMFWSPFASAATTLTVPAVSPGSAYKGISTKFSVLPTAVEGSVKSCSFYVGTSSKGSMTLNTSTSAFEFPYTFSSTGTYRAYAICKDQDGASTTGEERDVLVSEPPDMTSPTVGAISATTATVGVAVSFSVSAKDNVKVKECSLLVNENAVGTMTLGYSTASIKYTFTQPGSPSVSVRCVDESGNAATGAAKTLVVYAAKDTLVIHDLFKMSCEKNAGVNDPCKAVYYYGKDGMRHAFPNEKVYRTWYEDFDDVILVAPDVMASIPLGKNVTYRPGIRLIKFATAPTVYALRKGGIMLPIANEEIAIGIFGAAWGSLVDDVSDAFFSNYMKGDPIDSTRGYDAKAESSAARTISDNF